MSKQEKVLNLDELLHDPIKDMPPILAMIISVVSDFGINLHFQSDSKRIEVIATRGEGEDKEEVISYLERTDVVPLNGD